MERLRPDAPLPSEMQGRWVDVENPFSELIIQGGEVVCFGQVIQHDYKLVDTVEGALTVSLKIDDEAREDTFQRSNITEIVITPDGEFHAYNIRFASQFAKVGA